MDSKCIINNSCKIKNCTGRSYYGYSYDGPGLYCFSHAKIKGTYHNIRTGRKLRGYCEIDKCNNNATYANIGKDHPTVCFYHKTKSMYRFIHYRCDIIGCHKKAKFSYCGYFKPQYCVSHSNRNMVNWYLHVPNDNTNNGEIIYDDLFESIFSDLIGSPSPNIIFHDNEYVNNMMLNL